MTRRAAQPQPALDAIDRRVITHLQEGIPIVPRPFAEAARALDMAEDALLTRLRRLLDIGAATRFGPLINADAAGGAYMLAALAVPQERFDAVAALVNAHNEVAHNYARDHRFNMWFVIAAPSRQRIEAVARTIERETALAVLRLPKLKEYFVDFRVRFPDVPPPPATPRPAPRAPARLDEADRALLAAMQPGLPLAPDPWAALAKSLATTAQDVLARTRRLAHAGVIRRIALVPNHYRLGITANGMSVWDVDDARIDELGAKIGALPFISHCYRRPRQPGWPYNLFAMVHGRNRTEAQAQVAEIARLLGDAARGHEVLFSTRILKKTGTRLFAPTPEKREPEEATCSG